MASVLVFAGTESNVVYIRRSNPTTNHVLTIPARSIDNVAVRHDGSFCAVVTAGPASVCMISLKTATPSIAAVIKPLPAATPSSVLFLLNRPEFLVGQSNGLH